MDRVSVGTWVKLTGLDPEEEEVFRIVPEGEANSQENEISMSSPLARALEGAQAGDKVIFCPPAGEAELTILEVGRL
jgi:transcription elongation factor GreA